MLQEVNEEGMEWLLDKENNGWVWGKEIEYQRQYNEWKYGEDKEEVEMEEDRVIDVCGWTRGNGTTCEYEGTKGEIAHHKHYAHGTADIGKGCIVTY